MTTDAQARQSYFDLACVYEALANDQEALGRRSTGYQQIDRVMGAYLPHRHSVAGDAPAYGTDGRALEA
ncbi:hypothetical protein ACH79_26700 [Bradyrhizobium sp. CCBAU 051011]|nr:hypothetical protein ACH79_26700 [Bradyrhizobium sp. CCBAU 051011]